jgi:lysophospholipase L1-like esterase
MFRLLLALPLLSLGCDASSDDPAEDDTPTDTTPRAEDDVATYVPDGYVPTAPTRIVFLGDSITAGDGDNDRDLLYKELLQENRRPWSGFDDVDLETSFPSITEVVDVSRGGATTDTLLGSQLPALEDDLAFPASGETVVVFTIGGNDLQAALAPFTDAEALATAVLGRVEEAVTWLQDPERFPDGVRIYATNVYEPSDGTGYNADCFFGIDYSDKIGVLADYNDDLAALGAELGFSVVDLRGHFLGHGHNFADSGIDAYDAEDPTLWMLDDCIHPNKRGHHEVRRLFHAAITDSPLMHTLPE